MNIYIYGNQAFKKEIHSTLDHANIKFKLDENTLIEDINSIEELKEIIQNNPHDIYLIDDEKIIKKNSKIKFLNPKDGIEEEFLLDNGIADLSVDSLKEIPKYILKKYEEQKGVDEDIQNSIIDIVDEAYENDEKIELDDELSTLLVGEENNDVPTDVDLDSLDFSSSDSIDDNPLNDEELEKLMSFNDDLGLNNSKFDYDEHLLEESEDTIDDFNEFDDVDELDNISEIEELEDENLELNDIDLLDGFTNSLDEEEVKNDIIDEEISIEDSKGEKMSDEFSELDSLNEQDILEALNGLDTTVIPTQTSVTNKKEDVISIDSSNININQLSELIGKLLQNKTLEITIKIKD